MPSTRRDRGGRIEAIGRSLCSFSLCSLSPTLALVLAAALQACGDAPSLALNNADASRDTRSDARPDARPATRPDAGSTRDEDTGAPPEDDDGGGQLPDSGVEHADSGAPDAASHPDASAHPDAAPMSNACTGRIGTFCGDRLGLPRENLYHCSDGDITLDRTCQPSCVQHNDGPDTCACPSGDGAYCGGLVGADPHVLYNCQGGALTQIRLCPLSCQVEPPGVADHCATCPSGDGLYCGGPVGADPNVLYDCQGGALTVHQRCGGACRVNPPGVPDACMTCPNGDGLYCGASIGMDTGTLYRCNGGRVTVQERCMRSCSVQPPGIDDACAGADTGSPRCGLVQWWNVALTYGPYLIQNGGYTWWDTDLAIGSGTQIQLRHASRLVAAPITAWGWQPQFIDMVTGQRFQFLHLQPGARYTNSVNTVYPAGTVVGLSGGNTPDTGYPRYSTGAHLCVETIAAWRTAFPAGQDACH